VNIGTRIPERREKNGGDFVMKQHAIMDTSMDDDLIHNYI
jgi:hypothetical protein